MHGGGFEEIQNQFAYWNTLMENGILKMYLVAPQSEIATDIVVLFVR